MTEPTPRRTGRGKGRPPATSREEIARGSLALASQDGLDALTIRRLAEFMKVAPMTIYSYVGTKEQILDLMLSTALAPMSDEPSKDDPWDERIHAGFMRLYDALREHPVVIEMLVGSRAITGPAIDSTRDALVALMESSEYPPALAVSLFNTLGGYVIGIAAVEAGRARRAVELGEHLATLSGDEFPHLKTTGSTWTEPIARTMVAEGLWHLLHGFTPGGGRVHSSLGGSRRASRT